MENSFSSVIDSASSILVVLPARTNFDNVAAALSLYLSLRDKKEAMIFSPSPMTVGVNRLIGVNKIGEELGNKNLTIRFKGYDATNIDKVSYDIEENEFNLTVSPKAGLPAPKREQIELSHSGISADLVILVGGAADSDFPILGSEQIAGAKIAHVGARVLTSSLEVMSFARKGSSVSEVVASIISESGLTTDADVATNLVMGMEEGSSKFTSSDVTPETFETFAKLLRAGGQRAPKVRLSPADFPPGAIPTQPFAKKMVNIPQPVQEEVDLQDMEGTAETEQEINPPDDWLQPKVFKGADLNPDSFSENKG
ncbi:MAG TPA: hypothetical protein VJ227_00055 [Patescibacteria group bacterium]|nr:hypothetical protein [Patescibacteria group bacterium]